MTTQEQYIERLKQLVIEKFGQQISSADDCNALSEIIEESVGVRIDMPSLQMLFSRNRMLITPRPLVLSTLARYVGYGGWSDFCTSSDVIPVEDRDRQPITRRWGVIILTIIAVGIVVMGVVFMSSGEDNDNATTPTTEEVATTNLEDVYSRWCAITSEHIIALRTEAQGIYSNIDVFLAEYYGDTLIDNIESDIRLWLANNDTTLDAQTIRTEAEHIAEQCLKMLEVL